MIAKILLTSLLTFFLSGGIVAVKEDRDTSRANAATERIFMKAVQYEGETLPWIELPVVEITGERDTADLVKAIEIDGNYYPSIELDAVSITPGA